MDTKQQVAELIAYLESALELAEKLNEPTAATMASETLHIDDQRRNAAKRSPSSR